MRAGTVATLLGLILAAGCRPLDPIHPPPLPADPALSEVETREVQLDDDFITVRLHIPPTPEPRKPTVIVTIGDRSALLKQGMIAVTYRINWDVRSPPSPPKAPSENTVGKWILASPSAGVLGRPYLRTIATTANDVIPKIVDYLLTVPEVDPARLGIAGSSTHGFITLQAVARDPRLAVAVVLAACGDYHRFLQDSSLGMKGEPLALEPDYEQWLRSQEPIRHPRRVIHAAVLMVNRNADPIIPFGCADRTAEVLSRTYRRGGVPQRFRFIVYESDLHGLDQRDGREAIAWFSRWFQGPRPTSRATLGHHSRRRGA